MITIRFASEVAIESLTPTHILTLTGRSFHGSSPRINPGKEIAIWFGFGSAKYIGRPSLSEGFCIDNKCYYRVTGNGQRGAYCIREGRSVIPLKPITNNDHHKLVFDVLNVNKGRRSAFYESNYLCDTSECKLSFVRDYVSKINWSDPTNDFPIPQRLKDVLFTHSAR